MRLLVFSDIHNNLAAVKALRRCETNAYDAIVVAGDIGGNIATEFFVIADTFGCPIFHVHGNWDSDQPYVRERSKHGVLLHGNVEAHSGYFFTGFSGCPTHWGRNPHYAEAHVQITREHAATLAAAEAIQGRAAALADSIEAEFNERRTLLLKRKSKTGTSAHRRAQEHLRVWRDRKLERLHEPGKRFRASPEYQRYLISLRECKRAALARNRQMLIEHIEHSAVPMGRLIVVSHERLRRLADDGITPLLHIFGHRHEYKYTEIAGTHYLNAAALDPSSYITLEGTTLLLGGYCRVTLQNEVIEVSRHTLPFTPIRVRSTASERDA